MFTVYAHRSPSGKVYVGWTSRPRRRWNTHVNDAVVRMSPTPFHKAIRKYGAAAFTHEVLEVMTTDAGARRAEQLWIKELGAFGPRGYNATLGGDGAAGMIASAETRAKLSAARRKRTDSLRGFKHSAESRANMSAAHKGQTPTWIRRRVFDTCTRCGSSCALGAATCGACNGKAKRQARAAYRWLPANPGGLCACGEPCKPRRRICRKCVAADMRRRNAAKRAA